MASIIAFFIGKLLDDLMLIQVVPRLSALCLPSLHSNSDLARCCRRVSKVPWVDIARLGFA